MLLYFLRHGIAEDAAAGQPDYSRALTERGRERMQAEARALKKLGVQVSVVLTSPLVRARETAEIVAETLACPLAEEQALAAGCTLSELSEALDSRGMAGSVMVVGHEPDFSIMIGQIIGGGRVEMKKGALACLEVIGVDRGTGVLRWLIPGKTLAEMG